MNILIYCAIERIPGGYKVRYVKNNSYRVKRFDGLVPAITWAIKMFRVSKDEVLNTLVNY